MNILIKINIIAHKDSGILQGSKLKTCSSKGKNSNNYLHNILSKFKKRIIQHRSMFGAHKKYLCLIRNLIAGLWPMNICEREDCLAKYILCSKKRYALKTNCVNCYILNINNTLRRYAVAVSLPELMFNTIFYLVFVIYICIYSTPFRIKLIN